jgi:urease accessory protein
MKGVGMGRLTWFAAAALALAAAPAWAHGGAAPGFALDHGLASGLAHPLSGLDHFLAMTALGVWAAQLGGRATWALPAVFVAAMAGGGALGMAGLPFAGGETVIALSVLLAGAAVLGGARAPLRLAALAVTPLAMAHGHAHGLEAPAAGSAAAYAMGYLAATASLHAIGLGLAHLALHGGPAGRLALRLAGAGLGMAGAALLAG